MPGTRWLFNFSRSHLLISSLISWATGVQSRNFLPMPLSWHESFHLEFSIWGLTLGFLIHLELVLCDARDKHLVSFFCTWILLREFSSHLFLRIYYICVKCTLISTYSPGYPVLPGPYIKEAVISPVNVFCIFMKTQWLKLHTIMTWFSALAPGSACLFLWMCHAVLLNCSCVV